MAERRKTLPRDAFSAAELAPAFEKLRLAARHLPEVEDSTWYGTPSLKVRGKSLCRVKDPAIVVLMCPLEEKELLMEAVPDIYFETDHYRGWPAILIRIDAIPPADLELRMERAFVMQAPKTLLKTWQAAKA
jgi:hypothetical protein